MFVVTLGGGRAIRQACAKPQARHDRLRNTLSCSSYCHGHVRLLSLVKVITVQEDHRCLVASRFVRRGSGRWLPASRMADSVDARRLGRAGSFRGRFRRWSSIWHVDFLPSVTSCSTCVLRPAVAFGGNQLDGRAELMQKRRPVGGGPSSNTCPRCAPQRRHITSTAARLRCSPRRSARTCC